MTEQTRADAVAEGRRKREFGNMDPSLNRFGVGDSILDLEKYVYRSVPDTGNRLYMLTEADDYEFVTLSGGSARKADANGVIRYQETVDGQARYTYLLRKLKEYDQADRRKRLDKIDREEEERKSSEAPEDMKGENTYKPRVRKS